MSDSELLRSIAGGGEHAFVELLRRYLGAIKAICRAILGTDATDDCTQEVSLRVWQKSALFSPAGGSAAGWLLTVARNSARNLLRRRPSSDRLPIEAVGSEPRPAIDKMWLEATLGCLPANERRVIELAYVGDLSQSQIAATLDIPLGTVKSWNRRGLNRLAALIGDEILA